MKTMKDVESYVHESPDSALAVLAGFDTTGVSSSRVDALYTLLNSIAHYRLYIDEQDDSALVRASDFFRKHGDEARLMKALFLIGYYQYNHGEYGRSILTLTEADLLADQLNDHFYGGLICRQMLLSFDKTFNYIERLESARKSYMHFTEGNFIVHSNYALLQVGEAYTANDCYDEGAQTLEKVVQISRQHADTILLSQAQLDLADNYIIRGDKRASEALQMILYVNDSLCTSLSYYNWANAGYAAALLQDGVKMEEFLSRADSLAKTPYERYVVNYRRFESALVTNDSTRALVAARHCFNYLTESRFTIERDSVLDMQRDFYREQEMMEKMEHAMTRHKLIIVILSFSLSAILAIWVIRILNRNKRRLQWENDLLSSQVHDMRKGYSRALKVSLSSGMRFFNKLAEFKWVNQPQKVLPYFEKVLNDLATDEHTIREMMTTLNETRNDLMIRLADQVPALKKDDLMIYCYLANRFDHTTICTVLNRTPGVLNAKVYRIREKIRKSGAQDADAFLEAISN
jgi:hypothetical protein